MTNFATKVAQIFNNFWGYFEKCNCLITTSVATFGATLGGKMRYFYLQHLVTLSPPLMVASNQKITFDKNLPPKPTLFTLINLQSRQSHIIIIMIIIIFCLINIFAYNLDSIRNNF